MSIVVTLPYNPVWAPLEWAKKHCPSYITNAVHPRDNGDKFDILVAGNYKIDYFFANEKDALMFRLRWAQ